MPDVPTLNEAGLKDLNIGTWFGELAPAATPKDIVTKLNTEIRKVIERPDIQKQLAERGMEAFSSTPEEFEKFLKDQLVLWEKLIRNAKIEPQ